MLKYLPYPEKQLQADVCERLTLNGWRFCHFRPARTKTGWVTAIQGHPGFLDIVAVRGGRLLFIELKGIDNRGREGKLTNAEHDWSNDLQSVAKTNPGVEVYHWWPDALRVVIDRVLK